MNDARKLTIILNITRKLDEMRGRCLTIKSKFNEHHNVGPKTKLAFYKLVPFNDSLCWLRGFTTRLANITLIFIVARHSRYTE